MLYSSFVQGTNYTVQLSFVVYVVICSATQAKLVCAFDSSNKWVAAHPIYSTIAMLVTNTADVYYTLTPSNA